MIDEEALSDASESNPEMGTVDFFTILLLDIPEFQDISERCMVEVGLSTVGNLLIVFKRHTNRDGKFCNDKIKVCLQPLGTSYIFVTKGHFTAT